MEHFGITEMENYSNSYLVALFANGKIKQCEDSVHSQCQTRKLFQIPYNYTFTLLMDKFCISLHIPNSTFFKNLYFQKSITKDGVIKYDAPQISTYFDVLQMTNCKYEFHVNKII